MNTAMKQLADTLKHAIRAESDGHAFYMMAAKSTEDAKGKEIFEQLAEEETGHMKYLKGHYMSLMETGTIDPSLSLGAPMSFDALHPIFSEELTSRVGTAHFEMSALSIGITLETNAFTFYDEQAEKAEDLAVKTFFYELAEWERAHYRALLKQQEMLKEAYWAANGFAPY